MKKIILSILLLTISQVSHAGSNHIIIQNHTSYPLIRTHESSQGRDIQWAFPRTIAAQSTETVLIKYQGGVLNPSPAHDGGQVAYSITCPTGVTNILKIILLPAESCGDLPWFPRYFEISSYPGGCASITTSVDGIGGSLLGHDPIVISVD